MKSPTTGVVQGGTNPTDATPTGGSRKRWWVMLVVSIVVAFLLGIPTDIQIEDTPNSFPPRPLHISQQYPVLWMAPFFTRCGYGTEAIDYVLALEKIRPSGIAIAQHGDSASFEYFHGLPVKVKEVLVNQSQRYFEHPIAVCHSEPGAWHPPRWPTARCPPEGALYKIGRTMFETDRIPSGWEVRCNEMDQIWVPTKFHKQVFSQYGVAEEKLVVIPESVDVDFYDPKMFEPLQLPAAGQLNYKFLSIFKWEDRKGWQILLKAFIREFKATDKVGLYILSHSYHATSDNSPSLQMKTLLDEEMALLGLREEEIPPIYIIDRDIPTSEMPRLYKSVDAFVLPSRGEGWGRPHVEAMAMELPVISTYWSGPTEYMTEDNSYPLSIESDLVPISTGPFQNHLWAEPSFNHLKELMRHLVNHPEEARLKGKAARQDMLLNYHPDVVAALVNDHLKKIEEHLFTISPQTNRGQHAVGLGGVVFKED